MFKTSVKSEFVDKKLSFDQNFPVVLNQGILLRQHAQPVNLINPPPP
jgi:hypothetical protein